MIARLFNWLRTNFTSILLASGLAFTIWIVAVQEQNPVTEFELDTLVQIDVVGLGEGLIITNDYPRETQIRLLAQQNTIPSISSEDVLVTADLTGLGPDKYQIELILQIATQAELVSANPSFIQIIIERESERELPVRLDISGELPTGYQYNRSDVTIEPDDVVIKGPESLVDTVSEIIAEISITEKREQYSENLSFIALDANGNPVDGLTIIPGSVNVTIPVYQEAGFRELPVRVATIGRPASGYYPTSRVVTPPLITVQGDPEIIENLPPLIDTEPVNLTGLTDDLLLEVALDLPNGVTAINTPTVQVLITIAAQQDSRSVVVDIETVGLAEGLAVALTPEEVEVFLSGPLPVLQVLNPDEDVIVIIDLIDLDLGTYQLEPAIQIIDSDIQIDSVLPEVIEIEIIPELTQ